VHWFVSQAATLLVQREPLANQSKELDFAPIQAPDQRQGQLQAHHLGKPASGQCSMDVSLLLQSALHFAMTKWAGLHKLQAQMLLMWWQRKTAVLHGHLLRMPRQLQYP